MEKVVGSPVAAVIAERARTLGRDIAQVLVSAPVLDRGRLVALLVADLNAQLAADELSLSAAMRTVPVPAAVVEEALRTFDAAATAEEVRRLRESGGLALADFLPDLERTARSGA